MKRIRFGIITFWETEDNYGQVLQAWALQHVLKRKGVESFLVRTIHDSKQQGFNTKRVFKVFSSWGRLKMAFLRRTRKKKKVYPIIKRRFQEFKNKYVSYSDIIYTYSQLKDNPPEANAFISGSDQVWNYPSLVYLQDWVPDNVLKFSYAASFGKNKIPTFLLKEYKDKLDKFDIISVREFSAVSICEEMSITKPIYHVLDPTLMLSIDDYKNNIEIKYLNFGDEKYFLLYLLGNKSDEFLVEACCLAKKRQCKVILVPSQNYFVHDFHGEVLYPSIEEMLGLIERAECVITNSFHGTIFSILFERPFYTVPLKGEDSEMNERVFSLFDILGLKDRFFSSSILDIKNIDYTDVWNRIEKKREESYCVLDQMINLVR